jgi:N-acetylglucosamine malate deacetylase 2
MKFLFIFAHPDDESVACAGTIHQLVQAGHQVHLIHTTDGGAGEVTTMAARNRLKELGSVAAVRQEEMQAVHKHLGLASYEFLSFSDGAVANQHVWQELKAALVSKIDEVLPDVVVTFDHTGWYYHLDHVGTSIATTLAVQEAQHKAAALLFSLFRPEGTEAKWQYVFSELQPTHQVLVLDKQHKLEALAKHKSQDLTIPKTFLQKTGRQYEKYQLAFTAPESAVVMQELQNLFLEL